MPRPKKGGVSFYSVKIRKSGATPAVPSLPAFPAAFYLQHPEQHASLTAQDQRHNDAKTAANDDLKRCVPHKKLQVFFRQLLIREVLNNS